MKSALIIISVLACAMNSWAADTLKYLAAALEAPWESVTVSEMIDQGCVAPMWDGVRVRSAKGALTISTWKDNGRGRANDKKEGPAQLVTSFTREEFSAAILKHYQAAVASEDIYEHLASLATQEEREKELARIIKKVGHPTGGFSATGIDIRIVRDGVEIHFKDNYGDTGAGALQQWIKEITPQAK